MNYTRTIYVVTAVENENLPNSNSKHVARVLGLAATEQVARELVERDMHAWAEAHHAIISADWLYAEDEDGEFSCQWQIHAQETSL